MIVTRGLGGNGFVVTAGLGWLDGAAPIVVVDDGTSGGAIGLRIRGRAKRYTTEQLVRAIIAFLNVYGRR